ncbi:uncharacterized protein LOC122567527 [Bombus pyrosoma]|uniref:uncharacterized protein LOC122567527 n=1 Tax=Bombus pyrosoma TaxID=396416 RepID=UPI001CB8F145|nr:uncharacterized protein LOC122567527 [Bombus pyrosoma]XP_043582095.1 uncharacterized protein LOC122567527 [Bombus pyrosoma]
MYFILLFSNSFCHMASRQNLNDFRNYFEDAQGALIINRQFGDLEYRFADAMIYYNKVYHGANGSFVMTTFVLRYPKIFSTTTTMRMGGFSLMTVCAIFAPGLLQH